MTRLESAENTIQVVRQETDSCILMCSFGKDSIVTLDLIYPHFNRIVCVFMYFVKDLEHINCWLNWARKRYPKAEFVEIPHWNLSYILRGGLYCVPNPKVKLLKLTDVVASLRLKYGIEYVFLGMKKADGMNRNLMLKTYEDKNYINKGYAYPLAEWNQKNVLAYMKQHRLPEPVRYSLKASSGIGFNTDCLLWLEKNYPQDLQKIYKAFPFSERVLWEYHQQEKIDLEGIGEEEAVYEIEENKE